MSDSAAEYLFHQGTNTRAYEYMGCNVEKSDGIYIYTFRTWAPNANSVELISDFSGWCNGIPLSRITEKGIWELIYRSDFDLCGDCYKYKIVSDYGVFFKGDPYAKYSRGGADGASVIFTSNKYIWGDDAWLKYRHSLMTDKERMLSFPMNIYELHLGSFTRRENGEFLTYGELADRLIFYVKSLGYTHIEILPIQEFPYDGSWGYQPCAFYAPTSRFGTPDDFRSFVNKLHSAGIGIILDWVCAHFPKDSWGLFEYDGTCLYEYQGIDRIESKSWGTRFFDVGREEVQSFLISNALYFIREFHIDGLRVDAVASMIYLDYDKNIGEWLPNIYGTNENLESTAFFRKLNSAVEDEFPDVLMIAEESGTYEGITTSVKEGGLGFHMKWNMGFANDFYEYLSTDPVYRKWHHCALNFPIMYAFKEKYCLPISHDEVVHGKYSFIDKMHGNYNEKFSTARAALLLYMTYPGKKLIFMGTEYAQFREWAYDESLEWFMLEHRKHRDFLKYVCALNRFYLETPALWKNDFTKDGFEWILADEAEKNLVAYRRISSDDEDTFVSVITFSGTSQKVEIPIKRGTKPLIIFETENASGLLKVSAQENGNLILTLPPLYGVVIRERSEIIKIKT